MSEKDNSPAFPTVTFNQWERTALQGFGNSVRDGEGWKSSLDGMSLRDYFAAKAMNAFVSNHETINHPSYNVDGMAKASYEIADAMITERSK